MGLDFKYIDGQSKRKLIIIIFSPNTIIDKIIS